MPPSNYLSDEGWKTLIETLPDLRVISGLYLPEDGVQARVQEFCQEADGTVSVPRVTVGFAPDAYERFVLAEEMALHGVFSHFVHPDDVLDVERGALLGWDDLCDTFGTLMRELNHTYTALRHATASEGAAAVQRYDRMRCRRFEENGALCMEIDGFFDEAWLALRTQKTPARVTGGTLYRVADGLYWLRATNALVTVEWEAAK